MSDCVINPYSSSVCVLGTKSCVMKHTGIVERDKLIAELEEEIEHLWDLVNAPIDLQEENERLRTEADMYLAALKDIRSSASEYGFVLARVARQAIDAARRESDETL